MPTKTFRDPIHGDIQVAQMQLAVIDSDVFQRLRYVRQTGLLHFVFPGALHSRFVHSIGTMHIAQRVFLQLFPHYRPASEETASYPHHEARYIGTVFELAALLHDVGHCAFSHSIEKVDDLGGAPPLFPTLESLAENWNKSHNGLWHWWKARERDIRNQVAADGVDWLTHPQHEDIGLLLVYMAFQNPSVLETERSVSHPRKVFDLVFPSSEQATSTLSFDDLVNDVMCLLRHQPQWLPMSSHMRACMAKLLQEAPAPIANPTSLHCDQLLKVLHDLVSGTLDVDRMDYLLRDSHFAGTVVGQYDLDLLVNSLSVNLEPETGVVHLCIADRAKGAVDDFLWNRWQLYLQVYNHKACVMLDALFAKAFRIAVPDPKLMYFERLLQFTDDWVMTTVRHQFLETKIGDHALLGSAKLAFLRNKLPKHLLVEELETERPADETERLEQRKEELAQALGIPSDDVEYSVTSSELIKTDAELPRILRKVLTPSRSTELKMISHDWAGEGWATVRRPMRVRRAHFFTQRRETSVTQAPTKTEDGAGPTTSSGAMPRQKKPSTRKPH